MTNRNSDESKQKEETGKQEYPMLEKLQKIEKESHLCGEFLDFICGRYILFDTSVPREQPVHIGSGDHINPEKLLAEFFDIDLEQVECERQQLLKSLHS